ncbi:MAG: hemerythrin domain-containing protein [Elusimicrobiota bacterium]
MEKSAEESKEFSVTGYYQADHDRLDGLFRKFQEMKRLDMAKAKPFFREFLFGLQRHIVWEEEILFPVFEEKSGMRGTGPTEVMRMEHREIKKFLDAIHDKVRRQDPDSDGEERGLLEVLSAHNEKEESILYPLIDSSISKVEQQRIHEAMKNIPPEKYETCCAGHAGGEK